MTRDLLQRKEKLNKEFNELGFEKQDLERKKKIKEKEKVLEEKIDSKLLSIEVFWREVSLEIKYELEKTQNQVLSPESMKVLEAYKTLLKNGFPFEIVDGDNVVSLNGPDKPNFVLTDGRGKPVCEEYLTVLNSTPREELRACKLPDLSNSKIKPVEFKPWPGKKLKKDVVVYLQ